MANIGVANDWLVASFPGFSFWILPIAAGVLLVLIGHILWRKSKESDNLKYEFITIAAHKLRTPLSRIKWVADAIKNKKIGDDVRAESAEIRHSSNKLIELVNLLLIFSKGEKKKLTLSFEEFPIAEATGKVVDSFRLSAIRKKVGLSYLIKMIQELW